MAISFLSAVWPSPRYIPDLVPRFRLVNAPGDLADFYVRPEPTAFIWCLAALSLVAACGWLAARAMQRRRRAASHASTRPGLPAPGLAMLWGLALFVLLEIAMGFAWRDMFDSAVAPDPVLLWKLRPGFSGVYPTYGTTIFSVNGAGCRGRDIRRRPPDGGLRILVTGDSFTFGVKLRDRETFCNLVEERFRKDGVACEVVNAGVPGYSSFQALHQLRRLVPGLRPHIVVASFLLNDMRDSPACDKNLVPSSAPAQELLALLHRMSCYLALRELISQRRSAEPSPPHSVPRVSLEDCRRNYRAMVEVVTARGAKVCFLNMPNAAVSERHERYRMAFLDAAREKGAPSLDLCGEWRRQMSEKEKDTIFYRAGLRHLNGEGHRRVAARLFTFLTGTVAREEYGKAQRATRNPMY